MLCRFELCAAFDKRPQVQQLRVADRGIPNLCTGTFLEALWSCTWALHAVNLQITGLIIWGFVLMQALLEGISLSQPQPKIPSELIKFLGKTYNAWHIAIPLLESHVMLFPTVRPNLPPPLHRHPSQTFGHSAIVYYSQSVTF